MVMGDWLVAPTLDIEVRKVTGGRKWWLPPISSALWGALSIFVSSAK